MIKTSQSLWAAVILCTSSLVLSACAESHYEIAVKGTVRDSDGQVVSHFTGEFCYTLYSEGGLYGQSEAQSETCSVVSTDSDGRFSATMEGDFTESELSDYDFYLASDGIQFHGKILKKTKIIYDRDLETYSGSVIVEFIIPAPTS